MSRFRSRNAAGNWDHPRGNNGKFRPKLSQSVRASHRSVSYNAGARIPIVPGRLNLYSGVLFRVERQSDAPGILSRATDSLLSGVVARSGNHPGVANAAELLKGGTVEIGGVKVQRSAIIQAPTIRASTTRNIGGGNGVHDVPSTVSRAPNRKPRVRGANRRKAISGSRQTAKTISR